MNCAVEAFGCLEGVANWEIRGNGYALGVYIMGNLGYHGYALGI